MGSGGGSEGSGPWGLVNLGVLESGRSWDLGVWKSWHPGVSRDLGHVEGFNGPEV